MKEIKVGCIVFTYSCIRSTEANWRFLRDSIADFLESGHTFLIILNDSPSLSSATVSKELRLGGKSNAIICSSGKHGWQIHDLNANSYQHIESAQSMESILNEVQSKYGISRHATLTVGEKEKHFELKRHSVLHFHVGEQEELREKKRGLIPLTQQYEVGLGNVLTRFTMNNLSDKVIDYKDLIKFIGDSKDFFRSNSAAYLLAKKHADASMELAKKFPDDIVAIFGTGYPFYLREDDRARRSCKTPESILAYFDAQHEYFKSKIVDEQTFVVNARKKYSVQEMFEKFGLNILRNEFDHYEYEKMSYPPPPPPSGNVSFETYYDNTCFEIETDEWPCHYCVTLQSEERFPHQVKLKNTNVTCLPCKQTSFMLRNVMSCTPDIDMVVVVKNDKALHAERIKDYIIRESSYHLYDSDFQKTILENDGPIDLFVTEVVDLSKAFNKLLERDWVEATFDSIALWLPTIAYQGQLGLCFPIAFEPIMVKDQDLLQQFVHTRMAFAERHSAQQVTGKLSEASFYTKQLISNSVIVEILAKRLDSWRRPSGTI